MGNLLMLGVVAHYRTFARRPRECHCDVHSESLREHHPSMYHAPGLAAEG